MGDWNRKRFWKNASIEEQDGAYTVLLDGRELRTPVKSRLLLPNRRLAQAIADEWQAQSDLIEPLTMPVTRTANAAIDKVAPQHFEVARLVAAYGDADLLCYRAESPQELVQRQDAAWDPLLEWADSALSVPLKTGIGIVHVKQNAGVLGLLEKRVAAMGVFQLAAFHDLVAITGSLIIGFATIHKLLPVPELWARSRIDEDWQTEQWGEDEEALAASRGKKAGFEQAASFYFMVN